MLNMQHNKLQTLLSKMNEIYLTIKYPYKFNPYLFLSIILLNSFQIQSANLSPLQRMVEDINDQASDFTANSVALSTQTLSRLEDINTRFDKLYISKSL